MHSGLAAHVDAFGAEPAVAHGLVGLGLLAVLAKRADHPWAAMDDSELMKSANLYMKNFETGAEGYTLAAALILGKKDVIASIVPAYKTDAYVQRENRDRYDDRLVVRTRRYSVNWRAGSLTTKLTGYAQTPNVGGCSPLAT